MRTHVDGGLRAPRRPARSGPHRSRAVDRRAADRGDRQGAVARRQGHRHGRADGGALGGRGRAAVRRRREPARRRRGGALHLAPPRGDLRALPGGHGAARRPLGDEPRASRGSPSDDLVRAMVGRELVERETEATETGRDRAPGRAPLARGVLHRRLVRGEGGRDRRARRARRGRQERGRVLDLRDRPLRRRLGHGQREAPAEGVADGARWPPGSASCRRTGASKGS